MEKINKALKKIKEELEQFMEDEPITITMQTTVRKQVEDIEGLP